jgi:hypothetical protein
MNETEIGPKTTANATGLTLFGLTFGPTLGCFGCCLAPFILMFGMVALTAVMSIFANILKVAIEYWYVIAICGCIAIGVILFKKYGQKPE